MQLGVSRVAAWLQPGRGSSTAAPRYLVITPRLFDTGADPAELHSLAGAAADDDQGRTPGEQPSPSRVTL